MLESLRENISVFEIMLFLANIMYLVSYSVRDILWLRVLTVVAMMMCVPLFYQVEQYQILGWYFVFSVINLFHIIRLIRQRLPVKLSEDERILHETTFKELSAQQVRQILSNADWRTVNAGEVIVESDVDLTELILIQSGDATVEVDGVTIARLSVGQFIGEISFFSQGRTARPVNGRAKVAADTLLRCAVWPEAAFKQMVDLNSELNVAMYSVLGMDLVQKLLEANKAHPARPYLGSPLASMWW